MILKYLSITAIALISIVTLSCNRDKEEDPIEQEVIASEDQALAESMFDDLGTQSEGSSESAEQEDSTYANCATITVDTLGSPWPFQITVDFGEENCTGRDGRERRGKLVYTITDWYRNEGSTITLTPDNYYVNDHLIEGTRTSTNNGKNSQGQTNFTVKVENGVVTPPDGEIITWESDRLRTWVEGENTGFFTLDNNNQFMGWDGITDDVYEITGDGNGTTRNDIDYTVEISTPLRVQLDCRWITEGIITLTPEGYQDRVLDYGDGECDNKARVTIGEYDETITLRG